MAKEKTFREELEGKRGKFADQSVEFDALQTLVNEVNELMDRYISWYENQLETSEKVGKSDTQKVNSKGELIFNVKGNRWDTGTEEKMKERGVEYEPYYEDIYEKRILKYEELDRYTKARALAYKKLAEFFATLDVTKL